MDFRRIWIGLALILFGIFNVSAVFPNYINADTVLNFTQVDGNQTIGHYVINASNITINLNSSILTRNLTGSYDGSTIFSSNGFTNVTIKDGVLNWTDFGKVRPFKIYLDNRTNISYSIPDGASIVPFYAWLINGINETINLYGVYADGQCKTHPTGGIQGWYNIYAPLAVASGDSGHMWVSNENPIGLPSQIVRFNCSPASGTFNFWVNISYNTSTDAQTRSISGNISGRFAEEYSGLTNARTDNGTQSNDFILTNSDLKLINVTYAGSKYFWTNFSDSASNLSVGWYLDVQVNDSLGNNLSNANVTAWDKDGVRVFSVLTGSDGRISRQSSVEYIQNSTAKNYKSNYTINISKTGYTKFSSSINLTGNTQLTASISNISSLCGNISSSQILTSNLSSNGTCMTISANNIRINCAGFGITGNGSGIGINVTKFVGISINNCTVSNFSYNYLFWNSSDILIANSSSVIFYSYNSSNIKIDLPFINCSYGFKGADIIEVNWTTCFFNLTIESGTLRKVESYQAAGFPTAWILAFGSGGIIVLIWLRLRLLRRR